MHLEKLTLSNFRSFEEGVINFQPGLTVLTGENNSGKSNAIDAIRLLVPPLSGRRDLYCEQTDIRFDSTKREFEITGDFSELTPKQQGLFLSATTDQTLSHAAFGLQYVEDAKHGFVRPKLWAGQVGGVAEPGCRELVRHVYLQPLRDAKRVLASGNPTRILALLGQFLDGAAPEDIARELHRQSDHPILTKMDKAVATNLDALTGGSRPQASQLGFSNDEKLIDIARDLRFKLADHGIAPEELRYSGHGFANLLFMATIAVELERANQAELTLFLVEEPEAHLHPQLQSAVLSFLEEQAEKSRKNTDGGGELQVIVATHSPNLSAWVSSKNIVVFKSMPNLGGDDDNQDGETETDADLSQRTATAENAEVCELDALPTGQNIAEKSGAPNDSGEGQQEEGRRHTSHCIPLAHIELDDKDRAKIDRYIDVTKAALLFGGRTLLMEGIAEALLIPAIAKHHVLKDKVPEYRRFRSAMYVPIDSVDFKPYVSLLLTQHNGAKIADCVVVITDGDQKAVADTESDDAATNEANAEGTTPDSTPQSQTATIPGQNRKAALEAIAEANNATDDLHVFVSTYSLESELVFAGNEALMKEVYLKCHPKSEAKWNAALAQEDQDKRATAIQALFKDTRKGEFAHRLSWEIEQGRSFCVPKYLKAAIERLVASN